MPNPGGSLSPVKTVKPIILLILLLCHASVSQEKRTRTQVNSFADDLDAYLQGQSSDGFSGAVLVARGGKIILNKTYGGAAKLGQAPAFWIASNSKSFVAAAILRLQEQGKLSVTDPLTKFFADVPNDKRLITVHHLLSHTSGLPHKYAADGITDREQAVRAILAVPLSWKVGEGYHYSSDGFSLLAAIVEVASQRTFEDYLRNQVLKPARLNKTGFWGFEDRVTLAPVANPRDTESVRPTIYRAGKSVANWGYRGATGMYSTTEDLYRWMLALEKKQILNQASREQLWGKHALMEKISPTEEQFYGYGWGVRFKNGERLYVRHTGYEDWLGHKSFMCLFENGDAYVVLSNAEPNDGTGRGSIISREIQKRLSQ
jgi:CubicO group peptidase (beta-lactamase class C family)